jgi:hypothetical protein
MINYIILYLFKVLTIIVNKIPTTTIDFSSYYSSFFSLVRPFYNIAPLSFQAIIDILKLSSINIFLAIIILIILKVTKYK